MEFEKCTIMSGFRKSGHIFLGFSGAASGCKQRPVDWYELIEPIE